MKVRYETLADAIQGTNAPFEVLCDLALVEVPYIDFQGEFQQGQLVIHLDLVEEIETIFTELHKQRFPIHSITPIAAYDWDDEASMADNNSSAFNYREIMATDRLSNHSFGRAIDINPLFNPYFTAKGKVYPSGAAYDPNRPGTLTHEGEVVALFKQYGWSWGGDWTDRKDYQHFEKPNH